MNRGLLIAFEGLDCCGKSTQLKRVHAKLDADGYSVVTSAEPNDENVEGREIREILQGDRPMPSPLDFQRKYVKDRLVDIVSRIRPALERGQIYLIDRYAFSTIAYGQLGGCTVLQLMGLHEEICGKQMIWPNLNLLIDVEADVAATRLEMRGTKKEFFEKTSKLTRVRRFYLAECTKPGPFTRTAVINGMCSEAEVFESIWPKVAALVSKLAVAA